MSEINGTVRKMAIAASRVTVDVCVGYDEFGEVTARVILDRRSDAVKAALRSLEELALGRVQQRMTTAITRAEVDRRVEEKVTVAIERERDRIDRLAEARVSKSIDQAFNDLILSGPENLDLNQSQRRGLANWMRERLMKRRTEEKEKRSA